MANLMGGLGGAASGAAAGSMIAPGIGTAIGGAVGLLGGLFGGGEDESEKLQRQQLEMMQQIQAEIDAIPLPPIEAQKIVLERYKQAGVLTPEMESAITQGPSRMETVSADPRLKQAQMGALAKLQQLGGEGLNAQDKIALSTINRQTAAGEQARQQSILQNMQQRGVGGSGAELAAQLASSQAAAERQSQESQNLAAQAQARALDAIMKSGQLGGQIREQDVGEQERVASAADEIARFNAANQQNVQTRNVGSRNQAQQANLAALQDIMNRNVGQSSQEEMSNKALIQQNYQNQLNKVNAKMGAAREQGNVLSDMARSSADRASAQNQGIIGGLSSLGQLGGALTDSGILGKELQQQKRDFYNKQKTDQSASKQIRSQDMKPE